MTEIGEIKVNLNVFLGVFYVGDVGAGSKIHFTRQLLCESAEMSGLKVCENDTFSMKCIGITDGFAYFDIEVIREVIDD